jgi:hypothetical protein
MAVAAFGIFPPYFGLREGLRIATFSANFTNGWTESTNLVTSQVTSK